MKNKNLIYVLSLFLSISTINAATLPDNLNIIQEKALELTLNDYKAGKITAINDPEYLGDFTGHRVEHILMVADKSLEIIETFEKAIQSKTFQKLGSFEKNLKDSERLNFGIGIDKKTLVAAAIFHDSGMKSGGFVLDKDGKIVFNENGISKKAIDGNDVRKNHALNSAINVLIKREELTKLGVNVDVACLLCFAHSKSTSGIRDLSCKTDWIKGFDRVRTVVEAYNAEHKEKISFNSQVIEKDENLFNALSTAALAIRLGDVSRDSGKHAKSQSGGEIVVYKSTVNSSANDAPGEAQNARVYNYRTGFVKSLFSRQIHIGEQNNVLNHTLINDNGKVYHEMTMDDANYAPYSTFQNVKEHCGEIESAPDANIELHIVFKNMITNEYKNIYNKMRQEYYEEKGSKAIKIVYTWDL